MFKKYRELFKSRQDLLYSEDETRDEPEYRNWWTREYICDEFCALAQSGFLNSLFSLTVIDMLVVAITRIDVKVSALRTLDVVYNVWYALVVASVAASAARQYRGDPITWSMKVGFAMDILSYLHYMPGPYDVHIKVICYFIRVHRPLRFISATDKNTMNSSLLVTALKYCYYSYVLRILCAYFWILINKLEAYAMKTDDPHRRMEIAAQPFSTIPVSEDKSTEQSRELFNSMYIVNKIFIPIGPTQSPTTDFDRVVFLVVMIIGILMVTGAAVTALSSVISIHMRPEENFRTRFRIIMRDLTSSGIPLSLCNKVEKFYKMYWHKQRAVSSSHLLGSFPPVLPQTVYTDIYFEATQKSGLLRDLSYQFLSEIAKYMETILYIPGDCIIKRNSQKNAIIYITYGDIEMLTAEDDISPMLRFTRGTVLTPWGACPAGGGRAHVEVRAGTFCAARVLGARGLWRAALMHGRDSGQTRLMMAELREHINKVKRHYAMRKSPPTKYKSSILQFKKNLMALKEARDANGELLLARPDYLLEIAGCYLMRNVSVIHFEKEKNLMALKEARDVNRELLLARPDYLLEIAGCYLMRNRADTSLTDDSDAICLRQTFPCILQPTSSLLTAWNWLVAVLIVVVCLTYPYYLVYKKTIPLDFRFFDLMVTVVYVLDIIVYLSTGTNVEEGVPITFMETSSKQVRSPWFLLDVLGTLPIFAFIGDGQFNGINKLLRFPKVIRVIQSLEEEVYQTNAVRFFICSLLLAFTCYFLAAVQQAFVCHGYGYCLVTNFTHEPFWTQGPLDDLGTTNRLYFSLYWAISVLTFTTHMELGGPLSKDYAVHMYTTLLLEVCIALSICIEAVYSATIMVTTAFRESFDSCVADARQFLTRHRVPPLLRQRFIQHLQLCWNTRKAYSMSSKQASVFHDLPPHVYQDILARQRCKYILCIPFMKLLHKEDLKNVSSNARIFYCAPNEILLNTGDISTEMYIIKQGFCEVLNPDTKEIVGTLIAKNHFGVLECLFRLPAFYTVRTTTHVQLLSISRKYLAQALEVPQIKDAINFAKEQEEYKMLQQRREPFVSYRPPPPVSNRILFKLPRKFEKDDAFLQPFKKFGFFAISRNIFPRFTFRPDSVLLTRYELCRACCAVACAFIIPGYTYLVLQHRWLYYAAIVLDLFAYSDIVFRMFVGYFDAKGNLVYHPANTAAHYLRGAFFLDLFGCLPLEGLEVSRKYTHGELFQVTAMKQVLMLNRLLQLYRLPGTLEVLTSLIERRDIILVLQVLPLFMTMLNVLTTFLVFSSVMIYHSADEHHWAFVPTQDVGGSWINLFGTVYRFNVTATPVHLHLGCYFWIVYEATSTGYNTMAPTNLHIMGVLFWAIILGSLITIYMSVRIISLRSNVDNMLAAYQEHMRDLVQFMRREKLSKQLQKEMTDHYEYNWENTDGVDARNVLKLCDQLTLRSDAILHLYGPAFAKCPILSNCDASLLRVLGRAVRSIYFLEGTTIFQEDDVIQSLYIVYSGQLQLRTDDWAEGVSTVTKLSIGSMVGNLDDVEYTRVASTLVATTDVHLLQMKSATFHGIVRDCDFPVVYKHMEKYRGKGELFIIADVENTWRRTKSRVKEGMRNLQIRSRIVQIYLIIISLLCVYTDMYNAGFQCNSETIIATLYVLDVAFLVKIALHFAAPNLVRLPTVDHEKANERYVKSNEFMYDIASCLPIESFCLLSSNRWLLLSLLRLNRMLRVKTVYKYLKRYQKRATENLAFSTVTLVMWFTVFIHCCTCLWYFIGLWQDATEATQSWFYDDDGKAICSHQYICSVYFVLTTFAHNGVADIMPRTEIEVVYVSALLIVSTMVYVVYVGEFANIVHYASFRAFSYYSRFLKLQEFLNNNRVSPVLIALVNKYAVLLWREARGEQLPGFLVTAPLCLKLKVMSQAYKDVGAKHPVFKFCEPALLRQIVGYLRQYYYDEDMYVVKQTEITNSMYLVHAGEVQEVSESYDEEEGIEGVNRRVYTEGEYFGVEQGLVRDKPFRFSYKTTIKSQILTLRLDDWEFLLKHFPDSKTVIDNYQWPDPNDDDDGQMIIGDGSTSSYGLDPFKTLGTPGGSETDILNNLSGSNAPPGSPPATPPRKPGDRQPSEPSDGLAKSAPLIELKRKSKPGVKISSPTDDTGKTVLADDENVTARAKRESEAAHGANIKQAKVSFPEEISAEKTSEEILHTSSSTELLERIRKSAIAVENRVLDELALGKQNDEAPRKSRISNESEAQTVVVPYHSVEEYLAHKFKMLNSYIYSFRGKDKHEHDVDTRVSTGSKKSRVKYMDRTLSPGREDFRHLQLAGSSASRDASQRESLAVLNLDRPFDDQTSLYSPSEQPLAVSSDLSQRTPPTTGEVPQVPVILKRVDSLEPQAGFSGEAEEKSSQTRLSSDTTDSKGFEIKPVDFDSDVAAKMAKRPYEISTLLPSPKVDSHSRTLQQAMDKLSLRIQSPEHTSDKSLTPSTVNGTHGHTSKTSTGTQRAGPDVVTDFDSDVAARMPMVPKSTAVEQLIKFRTKDTESEADTLLPHEESMLKQSSVTEPRPEKQGPDKVVDYNSQQLSVSTPPQSPSEPSTPIPLLVLEPRVSLNQSVVEPPAPPSSPVLLALPPIPVPPTDPLITAEQERSITPLQVLEHKQHEESSYHSTTTLRPREDQITDLAAVPVTEVLPGSQEPTTSKARTQQHAQISGSRGAQQSDQGSSSTLIPAILPPRSPTEPSIPLPPLVLEPPIPLDQSVVEPPAPPSSPVFLALPPIPVPSTEPLITAEQEPLEVLEHAQFLQEKQKSYYSILGPRHDQIRDLAELPATEALPDSQEPTTSNAIQQPAQSSGSRETQQSDQASISKLDSKNVNADNASPDENKSDQKDTEDKKRKEKKD